MSRARYDGVADWYEQQFVSRGTVAVSAAAMLRLLGDGSGRLLDVGCGTGAHTAILLQRGWDALGVDISEDQLRLARKRGVEVVQADAAALPLEDATFDAVVSIWTHTDVDDFGALVVEVARVLRPGGPFVYVGAHPCFVGPHSRFISTEGVPELHPGYWETGRYDEGPAISPHGLRAKVGATHLPLGALVQAFLSAGFRLEHFEELKTREYPNTVALRCRR